MYPKVQIIRGGDQSIDQLHAGNLWCRKGEKKKKKAQNGEKLMRNYLLNGYFT